MYRIQLIGCLLAALTAVPVSAAEPVTLFDGTNMDHWECREGAWTIEDGTLRCHMEEVTRNGKTRTKGMGYLWTSQDFGDFELKFSYKLSTAANSGVFFRTNPSDPVQSGFEIQLLDNDGFGKLDPKRKGKNSNGALYDCVAPAHDAGRPVGQWNELKLTCEGPAIRVEINGQLVTEADIDQWDTPNKNPDGSANKFKTALRELPRTGRIGFQNHGQVAWFKDVTIRELP